MLNYSLKFNNFSKYASSLMFNPGDEMRHFVMGESDNLVEACRATMIQIEMDLCHLVVHALQVEDSRHKSKNRVFKRERPYDGGTSKGTIEICNTSNVNYVYLEPKLNIMSF